LLAALAAASLAPGAVDWLIVTHVHLDHAGGAGLLLQSLPNARLVVHPRGARHMIDPSALFEGARAVYGDAEMARSYGTLVAVAAERVLATRDGMTIELAGRPLVFLDTPGHARHHHAVWDERSRGFFTGDTFGISYREFDVDGREWVIPTTTPVHFDPDALLASIDRLMSYHPRAIFLTHYSRVRDVERLARDLKHRVTEFVRLARLCENASDRTALMRAEMFRLMSVWLDEHGYAGDLAERHRMLDTDVELNVQGLEVWLNR
jgi:glyoxylase-like metal-dependent hydrolase (beta-lactamase superfamily II)